VSACLQEFYTNHAAAKYVNSEEAAQILAEGFHKVHQGLLAQFDALAEQRHRANEDWWWSRLWLVLHSLEDFQSALVVNVDKAQGLSMLDTHNMQQVQVRARPLGFRVWD
jgi:hypothetical protein